MLAEVIKRYGEEWSEDRRDDFDASGSDKFVDFYNNGGLTIRAEERHENVALTYAAVYGDKVKIGGWLWYDDEDFDEDAEWCVWDESEFSCEELNIIIDKIKEIYGKQD